VDRDIRDDLRQRLAGLEKERRDVHQRLKQIDARETAIRTLLEQEERLWAREEATLFAYERRIQQPAPGGKEETLTKFLLDTLSDGRAWSLDDIKSLAKEKRLLLESKSPGRAINFRLVGLERHGYVRRTRSGKWMLVNDDAPSAATGEAS